MTHPKYRRRGKGYRFIIYGPTQGYSSLLDPKYRAKVYRFNHTRIFLCLHYLWAMLSFYVIGRARFLHCMQQAFGINSWKHLYDHVSTKLGIAPNPRWKS